MYVVYGNYYDISTYPVGGSCVEHVAAGCVWMPGVLGVGHVMCHFAWADQGKGQGYKCDVSLGGGIQIICTLENDATLYIDTTKPLLIVGLNLLILSLNLNLVTKCFLTRK